MTRVQKIPQLFFGIFFSAGVFLLAGCLRTHPVKSIGHYQLDSRAEVTLLLPPAMGSIDGTTQTTMLDLGGYSVVSPSRMALCSIRGKIFTLSPESSGKRWEFQAPSMSGWNTLTIYEEADSEWDAFLREIAKLASNGCFPKGMGVDTVQQRLVEAMPIPADKILRFYYSLGSFGFVDLHPGMQIRLEMREGTVSEKLTDVLFTVEGRSPVGVGLVLASSGRHLRGNAKIRASDIARKFADYPLLRLFLEQGKTSSEQARHAILLGAKTQDVLNQITDSVLQKGEPGCDPGSTGSTCIVVSDGTVSLLSTVTVNGRAAFYAPGTTLSQVLDVNTAHKPNRALQTVIVQRRFGDHYAAIEFPRDQETASKLILLGGDRIEWKQTNEKRPKG